ncbi:hypothetical protein KAR91_45910 [Candidatus Pacearchaeota archaeon]|nr:hypothetical protein [Candidatus Pacearchaeota archaeon]
MTDHYRIIVDFPSHNKRAANYLYGAIENAVNQGSTAQRFRMQLLQCFEVKLSHAVVEKTKRLRANSQ